MRRPFSLCVQGFGNSYLVLGILHLSFLDLGKGTDPLYVDVERYMLQLRRWAGFVSGTRQFRNQIPVSKLVSNFAISNLRSAISKLSKFAN